MDYFRFLNFLLPICFSLISQLELKLGIGGTSYEDFIRSMHLPMQLRYSSYLGLLSLSFSSFEFDLHLLSLWCIWTNSQLPFVKLLVEICKKKIINDQKTIYHPMNQFLFLLYLFSTNQILLISLQLYVPYTIKVFLVIHFCILI